MSKAADINEFFNISECKIYVEKLVSISNLKLTSTQEFESEAFPFWQVIYLDSGNLKIQQSDQPYVLKAGGVFLIRPNSIYSAKVVGNARCDIIVVSYECKDEAMKCFLNKSFNVSIESKNILSLLEREFQKSYHFSSCNNLVKVIANDTIPFGAEQLLCNLLEQFCIQLIRDCTCKDVITVGTGSVKESKDQMLVQEIIAYLHANIYKRITIDDISRDLFLSKTYIQLLFKRQMKKSIMDYFVQLKMDAAKILIEENNLNFTEIAEKLGFASIYHFSRRFKEISGITPSEYSQVIRSNYKK